MNIIINLLVIENSEEDDEVHCFCFQPLLDDRYCAFLVVNHSKQLALISLRQSCVLNSIPVVQHRLFESSKAINFNG